MTIRCFNSCLLMIVFFIITSACTSNGNINDIEIINSVGTDNSVKIDSSIVNNDADIVNVDENDINTGLTEEVKEDAFENDTEGNMGLKRMDYNLEKKQGKNAPTMEFFETVDTNNTIEYFEAEIGTPDAMAGSGIHYDIWDLEDGYSAWVHFSYEDNKVEVITIKDSDGKGNMIYMRGKETEK